MNHSPFPGMDTYLKDPLIGEDFHASLALEIRDRLAPGLRPCYVAAVFPQAAYDLRLDYSQPHPLPPLPVEAMFFLEDIRQQTQHLTHHILEGKP